MSTQFPPLYLAAPAMLVPGAVVGTQSLRCMAGVPVGGRLLAVVFGSDWMAGITSS